MSTFAAEADIRLRFQWNDTETVPDELVSMCLSEAHAELVRFLDPVYEMAPIEPAIVTGEILLAGARVMRALAARDASEQQDLQVGNQRIRPAGRSDALIAMAVIAEKDAWYLLEPYLMVVPTHAPMKVTDSTPILGS
jgi:hypothetical protein